MDIVVMEGMSLKCITKFDKKDANIQKLKLTLLGKTWFRCRRHIVSSLTVPRERDVIRNGKKAMG